MCCAESAVKLQSINQSIDHEYFPRCSQWSRWLNSGDFRLHISMVIKSKQLFTSGSACDFQQCVFLRMFLSDCWENCEKGLLFCRIL